MDGLERQVWRRGVHRWRRGIDPNPGQHRRPPFGLRLLARDRRHEARIFPYLLVAASALFLGFSVIVGFHRPTGHLFPLHPPGTVNEQEFPTVQEDSGRLEQAPPLEQDGADDRASRSTPREDPTIPVPSGRLAPAPRSAGDASSPPAAGATQPQVGMTPRTFCPPPLPPEHPRGKPDKTKPPPRPKVNAEASPPQVLPRTKSS